MTLVDDFGNEMAGSELFTADDAARMKELRLAIVANGRARANSRNEITRRHCTQRIEAAQAELETLETLQALATREEV